MKTAVSNHKQKEHEALSDVVKLVIVDCVNDFLEKHYPDQEVGRHMQDGTVIVVLERVLGTKTMFVLVH